VDVASSAVDGETLLCCDNTLGGVKRSFLGLSLFSASSIFGGKSRGVFRKFGAFGKIPG
jgi:hypothetical protein